MNVDHYYRLAMKHLADLSTYELLEMDPSQQIVSDYHNFLNCYVKDKVLDKYQYRTLRIPDNYQMQTIYFLPKIHKHPLKLRPIVASIKGIMVNAFRFMDRILQPYMKNTCSYCKNATHIINFLSRTFIPSHSYMYLASLDIELCIHEHQF